MILTNLFESFNVHFEFFNLPKNRFFFLPKSWVLGTFKKFGFPILNVFGH